MNLAKHSQMTDKKLTCGFTSTCAMASRYILKTLRTRMSPLSLGSPECRRRVPYALYLFLTFSFITLQTFNSFSQGGAAINTTGAS
ncbi:MAG: hypothetical protein HGB12_11960, partial [Bacteroidetes bacterium]|nr:hypothetical protein [Bacteroidota bacterium]